MWSSLHLSALPVWGELHYTVTATWRDDHDAEPVTLTRSGIAQMHPEADPVEILTVALQALNAVGLEHRQETKGR